MKQYDVPMKKSMLFPLIIFLSVSILRGQNLVVNPSFEIANDSVSSIPPGEFPATKAMGWSMPTRAQATLYGSIPTLATTNRALNRWKFMAKTGNNVVGIMTYGNLTDENKELREYLQGTLTKALVVGQKYYVSYWAHFHCEGTNNLGVAFIKTPLSTDSVFRLPLKPNVVNTTLVNFSNSNTWQHIRDSFIAREPYKHFIIGNFLSNKETIIQSNKFHYHKVYLDEIHVEAASNNKMPTRTFDMVDANDNLVSTTKNKVDRNVPLNTPSITPSVNEAKIASKIEIDHSINDNLTQTKTDVIDNSAMVSKPNEDKTMSTTSPPAKSTVLKGDVLILDKVLFKFNSSTLESISSAQLDKLVVFLQTHSDMKILVKGHTSTEGSNKYNQKLSENRSQSVVNYLLSKNIDKERLTFKGFGKSQPINTEKSQQSHQQNRRVEFEIMD